MIQRIQTLYLFLVVVLSIIFLTGDLFVINIKNGEIIKLNLIQTDNLLLNNFNRVSLTLFKISFFISITIASASFVSIFLFRKRKLQKYFTLFSTILSFVLTAISFYLLYFFSKMPDSEVISGVRLVIPPALFLFTILAVRGIVNDEKLIKSYERLR